MAKRKVNVLSNVLDQAPKTRAASYGKVVNSMKKEMAEAMGSVNNPMVISNVLDQAPKTRAAGYEENVLKPLAKEIDKRMDMYFMNGSDLICDYVNDFVNKAENRFILDQILTLEPGNSISFEIKREKIKYGGWKKLVGHPGSPADIGGFSHNFYSRNKNPIRPGEVSSAIIIKKDENDPKLIKVHAEQIELPGKGAMLSNIIFFHNPNVSDEDFNEIIKSESNETEEDSKDEAQENEVKKEGKKEKNQSIKDKLKGRF